MPLADDIATTARPAAPPLAQSAHVAIVGGGFSGTLQAINLLRHEGPRATLIERKRGHLARGVAYSAAHPSHLLNVRADNMSALPDEPDHFACWLGGAEGPDRERFASRQDYGAYLVEQLEAAHAANPDRLAIVAAEAVDIEPLENGLRIAMDDGSEMFADSVVLSIGNLPPHPPAHVDPDALGSPLYASDPWSAEIGEGLGDADTVLLIGTGLTAIDAALLLDARGFRGRMIALSRRGLVPRVHDPAIARPEGLTERPSGALSGLVRQFRERSRQVDWRTVVDELRPQTQRVWQNADAAERKRFVRHLRPFWDVHRHRLAPGVAAAIEELRRSGRLECAAGKITGARRTDDGSGEVSWRPRGAGCDRIETVRRIVNCTGPQGDVTRSDQPIVRNLLARGLIAPDALRLGIGVDSELRVVGADGRAQSRLYAIGPMTRGDFWEIVAVPDLRVQTWRLARTLSNAHWVGGEGL